MRYTHVELFPVGVLSHMTSFYQQYVCTDAARVLPWGGIRVELWVTQPPEQEVWVVYHVAGPITMYTKVQHNTWIRPRLLMVSHGYAHAPSVQSHLCVRKYSGKQYYEYCTDTEHPHETPSIYLFSVDGPESTLPVLPYVVVK